MPKLRELIQTPPEPEGGAEEQLEALRDYLRKVTQELEYLLTHLEADNINDTTFERISEMIPRPYTGLPLEDGDAGAGTSAAWSRGNHRHPHDSTKADVTALEETAADLEDAIEREADARKAHEADKANPHEVTKAQVGLDNVVNERQYSAQNPPPIPTPGEVGAIPATDKGSAGGVAELDSNGHVPSSQLPSYVDDVKEYPSVTDFPIPGESDKIYIALDTDLFYRWGGTVYAPTNPSLALGETSSTAYRGDRGKTAYDHSQTTGNPHGTTAAEVGARPDTWTPSAADVGARPDTWTPTAADVGAVPTTRTINGYDLSQDRSLDASDVGARPDTWMPSAADVGARPDTWTPSAADVGARPDTWTPSAADVGARPDTWVPDAEDIPYDNSQSGMTAANVQAAIDELSQGGGGGGPSPSDSNPEMDGTAAPGTALTYARGDHVHPTDTTRAAASLEINGHALTGDLDLTAADVGAMPAGATPSTAGRLVNIHQITTAAAGWYKFLTVSMDVYTRQTMIIAVESRYGQNAGLLRIHTRRSSGGTNFQSVSWIASGLTHPDIRWEYADGTWTFFILKALDPDGYFFQVVSKTDGSYGAWISEAVAEPVSAAEARDSVGLNANANGLLFSSVAVSAGTAQQILSISDAKITADYALAQITFADPAYITGAGSWDSAAGSFTLTGTATAATTADVLLVRKGN